MIQRFTYSFLVIFTLSFVNCVVAQKPLAIQNATIITGTGETISEGTILIKDGKIKAVGKDVKVPIAAQVIDASDHYVIPGLIEAHTSSGCRNPTKPIPLFPM